MSIHPLHFGVIIVAVILVFFAFRSKSKVADEAGSSKRKSSYGDELTEAQLVSVTTKSPVAGFVHVKSVDVYEDDGGIEIVTAGVKGLVTNIVRLSTDMILVCTGERMPCLWSYISRVRFFYLGAEVYSDDLCECEIDDQMITGYRQDGSDVCLLFNQNLTGVVENC